VQSVCQAGAPYTYQDAAEEPDGESSLIIAVLPVQSEGERLFLVSFLGPLRASLAEPANARVKPRLSRQELREAEPAKPTPDAGAIEARVRLGFYPSRAWTPGDLTCLSLRQRAVLDFVAAGLPNKQIAAKLGISQRTVECHRAIAMRKLGARNFADLMRLVAPR